MLHLPAEEVVELDDGLVLPTKEENVAFLSGESPRLDRVAESLHQVMQSAGLLAPGTKVAVLAESFDAMVERRQQSEEQLRHAQQIVSCTTDMLASLDRNSVYLEVNESYASAFNMTPAELVGKRPSEIFERDVYESSIRPNIQNCLKTGTSEYFSLFNFSGRAAATGI